MAFANHGIEILSALAFSLQRFAQVSERNIGGKSDDVGTHRLARKDNFQRIYRIFATQMVSAAADPFRKNGATQEQCAEDVGESATDQQGQQHVHVVG